MHARTLTLAGLVAAALAAAVGTTPAQAQLLPFLFGLVDPNAPAEPPPRSRIEVRPLPQSEPGPNSVRQCTAWLAEEHRPSGTVVVPRMHCWWTRG